MFLDQFCNYFIFYEKISKNLLKLCYIHYFINSNNLNFSALIIAVLIFVLIFRANLGIYFPINMT